MELKTYLVFFVNEQLQRVYSTSKQKAVILAQAKQIEAGGNYNVRYVTNGSGCRV